MQENRISTFVGNGRCMNSVSTEIIDNARPPLYQITQTNSNN